MRLIYRNVLPLRHVMLLILIVGMYLSYLLLQNLGERGSSWIAIFISILPTIVPFLMTMVVWNH